MSNEITLRIRSTIETFSTFTSMVIDSNATVKELVKKCMQLYQAQNVYLYMGNYPIDLLQQPPKKPLTELSVRNGTRIRCDLTADPQNVWWKPFVESSTPGFGESDVSTDPEFVVHFQSHRFKKVDTHLFVPSVCKKGMETFRNMWSSNCKEANKYIWTTDYINYTRFVVVRLRPELVDLITTNDNNTFNFDAMQNELKKVCYCDVYGQNGDYHGGDVNSWQVFTNVRPLITDKVVISKRLLKFTLQERLLADTWYGILLLHTTARFPTRICEDYVIPFKTKTLIAKTVTQTIECAICMDTLPTILYLPCKHLVCCQQCDLLLLKNNCPKCRTEIENKINVYF